MDFRDINFENNVNMYIKIILIFILQNVPSALGFEVKHSKIFYRRFRTYIIILYTVAHINFFFFFES